MLHLALIPGDYIGWGVCSKYLIRELDRLTSVSVIPPNPDQPTISGKVFHTIGDHHLTKVMDVTGTENYGYTFFENLLPDEAVGNATDFDTVFAGSTWCKDRLVEKGIHWSDVLIQGIDNDLFYPLDPEKTAATDYFVIYSGGKFEFRKGQDIVIKAVQIMQQRHKDVFLLTCWPNSWAFSMNTMTLSPYIPFSPQKKWDAAYIKKLLFDSGIDLERTEMLPHIPQDQFRTVYGCTDIGLFPNRCEGGTNLVLMEYMACGKPVIATDTSGHKDILSQANSLPLKQMKPVEIRNQNSGLKALWEEPVLEETVELLEYAYQHRDRIKSIGQQAGEDLKHRTWRHTALDLVNKLNI